MEREEIGLSIENSWKSYVELPVHLYLFQGLPKSDKMELIIQKAVELGGLCDCSGTDKPGDRKA